MTYVVTDAFIRCKYMDCVEVCPVDCFYEGENMLVINPNECIDCGVCEPECPAEAILPDTESGLEKWLELNSTYSAEWPNITRKKDSPADADEHKGSSDLSGRTASGVTGTGTSSRSAPASLSRTRDSSALISEWTARRQLPPAFQLTDQRAASTPSPRRADCRTSSIRDGGCSAMLGTNG